MKIEKKERIERMKERKTEFNKEFEQCVKKNAKWAILLNLLFYMLAVGFTISYLGLAYYMLIK
jgi:hypothetical protein